MMRIKQLIFELAALKYTSWYRWHPQLAMRYLPVMEEIMDLKRSDRPAGDQTLRILEIGSGGLGIAPYLKMPVTGVDVRFEAPIYPLLKPVIGDAANLKFDDNSFDVVVGMDVLEHLPKKKRERAIAEMLRIARKKVIIGVPCGNEAREHDQKMARIYISRNFSNFKFMDEHQEFGLPEEPDILSYIEDLAKKIGKKAKVEIKGNMNVKMREFLMKGWMSENFLINIIFRKVFLLFIFVFRLLDKPPYYRKIFFITL